MAELANDVRVKPGAARKRVLRIADEKSTYQTAKFLENLERELGFDVKKVQTDNGKEFTNSESDKKTLFELKLEEKRIEYVTTRHPDKSIIYFILFFNSVNLFTLF